MYILFYFNTVIETNLFIDLLDKFIFIPGALIGIASVIIILVIPFANMAPIQSDDVYTEDILQPSKIFEISEHGVVQIVTSRIVNFTQNGTIGSGFVYDVKGHIVTNYHVIEDSDSVVVVFVDGVSLEAKVIGFDKHTDLAILKIPSNVSPLYNLPIGDSDKLQVGESIVTIGNPFGLSGSLSSGIVSQIGRLLLQERTGFSIPNVIQIDAAINRGNSGGPMFNTKGEVVGITTAIHSATGDFSGVGFAIPSNTLTKIAPFLINHGTYEHPWIGISGVDVDFTLSQILQLDDTQGFLVQQVIKDGPADRAGIRGSNTTIEHEYTEYKIGGDIILKIDGIPVRQISDILIYLQREKSVGDEMTLNILRDDVVHTVTLLLESRPR